MSDWAPALAIAFTALFASPWIAGWLAARERRADKREDWARQDEVAARVKTVADVVKVTSKDQAAKLDQIHVLVNSNMTESMQGELAARVETLDLLEVALAAATDPTARSRLIETIAQRRLKIRELEAQLADRGAS